MERLCFGTFIDVLVQCRNQKINKTHLTGTVIKTIDPSSTYMGNDESTLRALNRLYKCDGDFSHTYSKIVELAPRTDKNSVISEFEQNVVPLIDKNKYTLIVLALRDIIGKDHTLSINGDNVKKFQSYIGKDIESWHNTKEYILSEFLVDIFLYTVIEIKNIEGKKWFNQICSEYTTYEKFFKDFVNSFKNAKDTIQVWETAEQMKENATYVATTNTNSNQKRDEILPEQIREDIPNLPTASLSIPPQCKQCFYCQMWNGNVKNALTSASGVYGECIFYNKNVISVNRSCDMFAPNYGRITSNILRK